MVPVDPTGEYRCFVVDVGVEVGGVEAGLRRMERGIGEVDTAGFGQRRGVDSGDVLGEEPELGEAEVAGRSASRSRISRSRSSSFFARAVKTSSARTRSISSASESMMSWLTLSPRTRPTASASSASSSGNRTVVCFVMRSRCEQRYIDILRCSEGGERSGERRVRRSVVRPGCRLEICPEMS